MAVDLDILTGFTPSQESLNKLSDAIANAFARGAKKGTRDALAQLQSVLPALGENQSAYSAVNLASTGIYALQRLGATKKAANDPELMAAIQATEELLRGGVLSPARSLARATTPASLARIRPGGAANLRIATLLEQAAGQVYLPSSGEETGRTLKSASQAAYRGARRRAIQLAEERNAIEDPAQRAIYNREINRQFGIMRSNLYAYKDPDKQSFLLEELSENLKDNTEAQKDSTDAVSKLLPAAAATAVGYGTKLFSDTIQSIWGQDISRNVFASEVAYRGRVTAGKTALGAILGAIGGGIIGSAVPGVGTLVGAKVGAGALGAAGGALGNLSGKYDEKRTQAYTASRSQALSARRDFLMYGGAGGSLAAALEDAGLASASSVNQMRWTGQTLPGAMALGMIGEQDMLMLSLMPEYFSAMMSGADASTLVAAYNKSVAKLPPQLRPLVASMAPGGSQDMYSAAIDPMTGKLLAKGGLLSLFDKSLFTMSEGYASAASNQAVANRSYAMSELMRDTLELISIGNTKYYDSTYIGKGTMATLSALSGANYMWNEKDPEMVDIFKAWGNMIDAGNWSKVASSLESFLSQGIQIQIYMNDDLITRERITSDNASDGNFQLTAGY